MYETNVNQFFGSHRVPGNVWAPYNQLTVEGAVTPPEEFRTDPYLPVHASDPHAPEGTIVIPRGRFLSVGYSVAAGAGTNTHRMGLSATGETSLTLHDGKNLTPLGISTNQMFAGNSGLNGDPVMSNTVKVTKNVLVELPFVASINNAYGTLDDGDAVTGYGGSVTSTNDAVAAMVHRGKPVKWIAKEVDVLTASASSTHLMTSATLPYMDFDVLFVFAAGALLPAVTAASTFDGTQWSVSLTGTGSATATTVVYSYGQDADQIAGQVVRLQSMTDRLTRDDYLRWVEMAARDWKTWPPAATRYPVTTVGTGSNPESADDWETPTTVTSGRVYRTANPYVSIHHPVLVAVQGTVVDGEGNSTTYSGSTAADWYILPTATRKDGFGYFVGKYHTIDWRSGTITLKANITPTAVRVTYSYQTDPRNGAALWGAGLIGLTDGSNLGANKLGAPAHLNLSDVTGAMRVFVN